MIGRLLKNGYKELPKNTPKKHLKIFEKSLKNMKKKKKKYFPFQKRHVKKSLKTKKSKPYIVSRWGASLNLINKKWPLVKIILLDSERSNHRVLILKFVESNSFSNSI